MACEMPHVGARKIESMAMLLMYTWLDMRKEACSPKYDAYQHGVQVGRVTEQITNLMGCTMISEGQITLALEHANDKTKGLPTDKALAFKDMIISLAKDVPSCPPGG